MITCQEFSGILCDLVSGELSAEVQEEVERHLGECPRCRAELEQYEQVIALARQLPGVPPPHRLLLRFLSAVQDRAPKDPKAPAPQEEHQGP